MDTKRGEEKIIINDITFQEICFISHPSKVFCNLDTKTIHLNANISDLQEYLLMEGLATEELIQKIEENENNYYEKNMGAVITHETIHLLLLEIVDFNTTCKWDIVDKGCNMSEFCCKKS